MKHLLPTSTRQRAWLSGRLPSTAVVVLLLATHRLPAQLRSEAASEPARTRAAAPAVQTAKAAPDGDTLVLSPFEVNVDRDDGFSAANAGTATRMALNMQDVPAPFSVMTRDFIDALQITNIQEATSWSTNGGAIVDGNGQDVFNIPFLANVRGIAMSSGQNRNNYLSAGTQDSYSLERYDFGRGPNAALFSVGANSALGGGMSATTKKARVERNFATTALTFGSWDYYRATLDVNQSAGERLAVRANGVWFDRGGWRQNEFEKTKGITLSGTYLITPRTELRIEMAHDRTSRNNPQYNLFDGVSGWDGVTTFAGPMTNSMRSTTATPGTLSVAGVSQLYGPGGLTYNGEPQGIDRRSAPYYVWNPVGGVNRLMNYQYEPFTRRADETNRTPILANGILYSRDGNASLLPYGNATSTRRPPTMLATDNGSELDFRYQMFLPDDRFSRALNNSKFRLPGKRETNSVDAPILTQTMRDLNFVLSHQIGSSWFFELGGNANSVHDERTNPNNLRAVRIDISRTMPDGTTNPYFLNPYIESPLLKNNRFTDNYALRANIAYRLDAAAWGNHVLNLALGTNLRETKNRNYVYSIASHPQGRTDVADDPRMWQGSDYQIRFRYYLYEPERPYTDANVPTSIYKTNWADGNAPVVSTGTIQPRWVIGDWNDAKERFDNLVFSSSSKFLRDKLVLLAATRWDTYESSRRSRAEFGDLPSDWDGSTLYYKPDAPSDWLALSYIPKNADGSPRSTVALPANTRPRSNPANLTGGMGNNGVQIGNTQYAGDRFRNDYSPPPKSGTGFKGSYGFVYHALRFVSVTANFATTYVPPPTDAIQLNTQLAEPREGKGYDAGLRFRFFSDRLTINTNYFDNREWNVRVASPMTGDINSLLGRNRWNDNTAEGRNQRDIVDLFTGDSDYYSQKNTGAEIEMVGRITREWRLSANYGSGKVESYSRYPLTRQLFPELADGLRTVLEDAGGMLVGGAQPSGAPGIAVANPAITPLLTTERDGAVTNYNNLWAIWKNTIEGDQPLPGVKRTTINIMTDYTIGRGPLKGLRLGLGAQFRGKNFLGYRTADTVANPAYNPSLPVSATNLPYMDDPNLGTADGIYVKQPTVYTLTVGYNWRLSKGRDIGFNLVIKNLLNSQQVVYQDEGVIARPPNGDFTKAYRTSVPTRIGSFTTPTSFLFTTTIRL